MAEVANGFYEALSGAPVKLAPVGIMLAVLVSACSSVPLGQLAVGDVRIRGNHAISEAAIEERIATTATPRFLGITTLPWVEYETFDPIVLDRDLARIEHFYRRRGFLDAKVRVARVRVRGSMVDVLITVEEGPPVHVRDIRIEHEDELAPDEQQSLRSAVSIHAGDRFDEERLAGAAAAIRDELVEQGHAYAQVTPKAVVDLGPHAADLTFTVKAGPPCVIGPVTFEGLGKLPEGPLRRIFHVAPGDPFSKDDLEAGRRSLQALGALASVQVEPDLRDPTRTAVPIRVSVLPSATAGFRIGVGVQADFTRADVHGTVGYEHRNFLGGLRRLTLEERPALVLFPTAVPQFLAPTRLLPAHRASLGLSQPSFLEARTFGTLEIEQSIYPVIIPPLNPDAEIILGYRELRAAIGPERTFPLLHVSTSLLYNIQASFPFTYQGPLDPELGRVVASYVGMRALLDLRDDPITPHQGFLLGTDVELAGGILGGDADDFRIRPESRIYFPLSSNVTLAARTTFGFLFARNYGQTLGEPFPSVRDVQLIYFRGFFSGGPDSNRGYGFREVGPHGVAPFLVPGSVAVARQRCAPDSPTYDPRLCSVALGGASMWEASVELRGPVHGPLSGVIFLDASDVSTGRLDIRLDVPHLSAGLGVRYATPVGPVRADFGFRIPGLQRVGGTLNPATEGSPGTLFGVPAALALGLGEAF